MENLVAGKRLETSSQRFYGGESLTVGYGSSSICVQEKNLGGRGCPTHNPLFTNIFARLGENFAPEDPIFENL